MPSVSLLVPLQPPKYFLLLSSKPAIHRSGCHAPPFFNYFPQSRPTPSPAQALPAMTLHVCRLPPTAPLAPIPYLWFSVNRSSTHLHKLWSYSTDFCPRTACISRGRQSIFFLLADIPPIMNLKLYAFRMGPIRKIV